MPREIRIEGYTFQELLDLEQAAARGGESATVRDVARRAAERARTFLQEGVMESYWYADVIEVWTGALEQMGFNGTEITYSGFWNQGDGASFTADYIDLEELAYFMATEIPPGPAVWGEEQQRTCYLPWVAGKLGSDKPTVPKYSRIPVLADHLSMAVIRDDYRYSHEKTCKVDYDDYVPEWQEDGTPVKYTRLQKLWDLFCADAETLRLNCCQAIYSDLEEEYERLTADQHLAEECEDQEIYFDQVGKVVSAFWPQPELGGSPDSPPPSRPVRLPAATAKKRLLGRTARTVSAVPPKEKSSDRWSAAEAITLIEGATAPKSTSD